MTTTKLPSSNESVWTDNFTDYGNIGFETPFDRPYARLLFITCYSVVFATCLVGNSMVLFAIARSPRLRSMTNFFLANLAIADLCVGVFCVLPNLSTFLSPSWILGKAMCKIYFYIWNVSYTASIIILTVIATERYIAIIHPLKSRDLLTPTKLKIIQASIWLLALLYNSPYLYFYDTFSFEDYGKVYCYSSFEHLNNLKALSLANFIIWYCIPLTSIAIMYSRVALTLWRTTPLSALRLQSYTSVDSECFRTNHSSKTYDSRVHVCHSVTPDEADISDGQDKSRSQSESRSSDKTVMYVSAPECGDGKNIYISPNGGIDLTSSTPTEGKRKEIRIRMCQLSQSSTANSVNGTSFKQRFKYRQTINSNSRRIFKARKNVIKLLIVVVVTFGVCVLPHMMKVLNHYWGIINVPHYIDLILSPVSFIVLFMNSALNPILYALYSENFKRSFQEPFRCFCQRSVIKF